MFAAWQSATERLGVSGRYSPSESPKSIPSSRKSLTVLHVAVFPAVGAEPALRATPLAHLLPRENVMVLEIEIPQQSQEICRSFRPCHRSSRPASTCFQEARTLSQVAFAEVCTYQEPPDASEEKRSRGRDAKARPAEAPEVQDEMRSQESGSRAHRFSQKLAK